MMFDDCTLLLEFSRSTHMFGMQARLTCLNPAGSTYLGPAPSRLRQKKYTPIPTPTLSTVGTSPHHRPLHPRVARTCCNAMYMFRFGFVVPLHGRCISVRKTSSGCQKQARIVVEIITSMSRRDDTSNVNPSRWKNEGKQTSNSICSRQEQRYDRATMSEGQTNPSCANARQMVTPVSERQWRRQTDCRPRAK